MSQRRITEDDWLRPLLVVRSLAERFGLLLTDAEEQQLAHDLVEGMTCSLAEELEQRVRDQAKSAGTA